MIPASAARCGSALCISRPGPEHSAMNEIQLVYASQPFGFDEAVLSNILLDARRYNKRDGITGALVCRHDIYLQLLEGPDTQVRAAYARIIRDDRHVNIRQLLCRPISTRLFAEWDMLHDPAQSWHWTSTEITDGALDRADADEIVTVFAELANRVKAGLIT